MAEYRVTVSIEEARGTREYLIDAMSAEEAESRVLAGEGTLDEEDLEVLAYGDVSVELEL